MSVSITINGENAAEVLDDLAKLAASLSPEKRTVQWKFWPTPDTAETNDVRMAASLPEETINPEDNAVVLEDKPKRKRRSKEEMEAERAAGLPPQEGDPTLEPEPTIVPDDIMSDLLDDPKPEVVVEAAPETPATIRREDVQTVVGAVIRNRKMTPAEIKAVYTDIGGAPQLSMIDGALLDAVYAAFKEALDK